MQDNIIKARREAADCINSLNQAMMAAGGSIPDSKYLEEISLMDFITHTASQNNIRFYYKDPNKNKNTSEEK